eukprot:1161997-Pelagomonas_calceolata.AAC.3
MHPMVKHMDMGEDQQLYFGCIVRCMRIDALQHNTKRCIRWSSTWTWVKTSRSVLQDLQQHTRQQKHQRTALWRAFKKQGFDVSRKTCEQGTIIAQQCELQQQPSMHKYCNL